MAWNRLRPARPAAWLAVRLPGSAGCAAALRRLLVCLAACSAAGLVSCPAAWLARPAAWLAARLPGRLPGCPAGWLPGCLDSSVDCRLAAMAARLPACLARQAIGRLHGWLLDCMTGCPAAPSASAAGLLAFLAACLPLCLHTCKKCKLDFVIPACFRETLASVGCNCQPAAAASSSQQ